jgi:ribonuclease HII
MQTNLIDYDLNLIASHGGLIGLDEVGRGCLAGPLVVVGCYLDADLIAKHRTILQEVNDSKKLTEKKRNRLAALLTATDIPFCNVEMPAARVDALNPLQATMKAMETASWNLVHRQENWDVPMKVGLILIDGNQVPKGGKDLIAETRAVVSGDATSCAIACASIVAKADRDAYMVQLDKAHPQYGFASHKGYGTKEHNKAVLAWGPCVEHRLTFSVEGQKIANI